MSPLADLYASQTSRDNSDIKIIMLSHWRIKRRFGWRMPVDERTKKFRMEREMMAGWRMNSQQKSP
jgi:hypothetical protein